MWSVQTDSVGSVWEGVVGWLVVERERERGSGERESGREREREGESERYSAQEREKGGSQGSY